MYIPILGSLVLCCTSLTYFWARFAVEQNTCSTRTNQTSPPWVCLCKGRQVSKPMQRVKLPPARLVNIGSLLSDTLGVRLVQLLNEQNLLATLASVHFLLFTRDFDKFILLPRIVTRSTVLDQYASFGTYFSLTQNPTMLRDAFEASLLGFLAWSARKCSLWSVVEPDTRRFGH